MSLEAVSCEKLIGAQQMFLSRFLNERCVERRSPLQEEPSGGSVSQQEVRRNSWFPALNHHHHHHHPPSRSFALTNNSDYHSATCMELTASPLSASLHVV